MSRQPDIRIASRSLGLLVASLGLASAALATMGKEMLPNSYLDHHVQTTSELITQIRGDRDVMDHYRRHFGMTDAQVLAYMSKLHPTVLTAPSAYRVYGVTPEGLIHFHCYRLKKGERIFSAHDGSPVLRMVCGNPLVPRAKLTASENPVKPAIGEPSGLKDLGVDEGSVEAPEITSLDTPADSEAIPATLPTTEESPLNQFHPMDYETPGFYPLPIVFGGLGGLGVLLNGGGGGSHHPRVFTPEPCTTLLVLGAAGMSLRKARRRRA